MTHYIKKLISEGEHQRLDFKFEISDSRKIARTLVAFANTDGGRLLIGVKDNGTVAGVRSEEELYMAEGAARLHCRPEVRMEAREWDVEGRSVVEIIISPGEVLPHRAPDPEGRWRAYVRQGDQNFVANRVQLKVWERQQQGAGTMIRYREEEGILLNYLERRGRISVMRFQRIAGISRARAEVILANFILLGIIFIKYEGEDVWFYHRETGSY